MLAKTNDGDVFGILIANEDDTSVTMTGRQQRVPVAFPHEIKYVPFNRHIKR